MAPSRIRILLCKRVYKFGDINNPPQIYNKKSPHNKRAAMLSPLICQDPPAGFGTIPFRRLPGFIGPVPPPLWIRVKVFICL